MAYVPDWERLADALERVTAAGIDEGAAKQNICDAIVDGKIKIRCRVAKEEGGGSFGERVVGTMRNGSELEIPPHLSPRDFDWSKSRPRKPWRRSGYSQLDPPLWRLDWIELFKANVTLVLCSGGGRHYLGDDRERARATEQWRTAWIKRFTERQRCTQKWINFAEIADWCSKEDQSIVPSKEKRAAAFDTLAADLLAGEFEENGRSLVLHFHAATAIRRMTRDWLKDADDHDYDGHCGQSEYLAHCWIPRGLFDRWLAKHRLHDSSGRFQPRGGEVLPRLKKAQRGRPAEYNWDGVKARLATYVAQHGPIQTSAELLQKCADFARELDTKKKRTPDDSTIRDAIETHALNIAAGGVPGKSR